MATPLTDEIDRLLQKVAELSADRARLEGVLAATQRDVKRLETAVAGMVPTTFRESDDDADSYREAVVRSLMALLDKTPDLDWGRTGATRDEVRSQLNYVAELLIPDDPVNDDAPDDDGERYHREADGPPTTGALLTGRGE